MNETAITLKEAARRLGLAYQTVFLRRQEIGFRLPGCRKWLVWPSRLEEISRPQYKVTRLALRSTGESLCRSDSVTASGGSIYARQAAKELDDLLGLPTKRQRKSITTA
ncbi:hypothetical protein [Neopusillimonas aromaticivorans]|uniref:hypothetical protein n=1 Tax=Neopusillimonas aromaticivorans TaxID=2979868 RepID=UPI0025950016|nr:hypothetical protein [Neopusillimonas aromaticivorans]WJJ93397.1 hypothetical protein N7E01_15760 [Neopusillimonas aromaticivorans]